MPNAPHATPNTQHATPFSLLNPHLLLLLLILLYAAYFSWYSINRHNTLNSYAADLSLIDQPMWNTVKGPGGFMELTWGDHQQPRLAEHFEPILVPLAFLFFLWDDVRILLIAQSVALALGALPVFWIAREQLSMVNGQWSRVNEQLATTPPISSLPTSHSSLPTSQSPTSTSHSPDPSPQSPLLTPHSLIPNAHSPLPAWAALTFAAVYLLSPHLQAANVADFHADPFVVTPLLFAFWYAGRKRWRWMWFWAVVAMATKETLPTLTAMLGLWLLVKSYRSRARNSDRPAAAVTNNHRRTPTGLGSRLAAYLRPRPSASLLHALALILVSTAWFLIATFLIVGPLAQQYFGTDGPIYFASRYSGGLAGLPALLQEPARWHYLLGLLAAVGFLPLLAPEYLILGLPVLVANLTSNFPGQYSGEQHYSAPLVVAFVIAAIYGTRRLVNRIPLGPQNNQPPAVTSLLCVLLWLMTWSLGYHILQGWTPLSLRMESYQATSASRRLPDLIAQVPPNAAVSASAAVHPHLAHRRVIYVFPTVQDATYTLVDVTDIPGTHPNDARARLLEMLAGDWQLLQADQGLMLAQRASSNPSPQKIPDSFFNFARATTPADHSTPLRFGDGRLKLLGYDLQDDPDDGISFRFYWQVLDHLPADLQLWPLIFDDLGQLLNDPTQVPMIATVWYPPEAWRPGEILLTGTLPQHLPDLFHLGIAVGPEQSFHRPEQWIPVAGEEAKPATRQYTEQWVQLGTFKRQGSFLATLPAAPIWRPLTPVEARFGPVIDLTGFWFDEERFQPASPLPVLLRWRAQKSPQTNYTVFLHLLAADGDLISQSDAPPTWLTPIPTGLWSAGEPIPDAHLLPLPDNLSPGAYTLHVGLYHPQTLERLTRPDGSDLFRLGQLEIE